MLKLVLLLLLNTLLFAEIGGQVFQDLPVRNIGGTLELNTYGQKDLNELGVANIKITAYPDNISTTTDSNGTWNLNVTQDSRIEFSNIPSYLQESFGLHNSVQFVKNGENNISFALYNPDDYSATTNPIYVSNIQQNGTYMGSDLQSLQFIKYDSTGMNSNYSTVSIPAIGLHAQPGTGPKPLFTISKNVLGSIWGKAYQKNKKRLFVSSMLQRHIGFKENPSTIYIVDYSNNSTNDNKVENFSIQGDTPSNSNIAIDLGSIDRTTNSNYTLPDSPTTPNVDFDAYAKVGKISYGGIDIDENNRTLWLVNLHQKGLISIDISKDTTTLLSSNRTINQYLIENLVNVPTCKNGELRPWALKIHEGAGYLGTICDASTSKSKDDLSASVLKFNLAHPENGFEQVFSFDLNYSKELRGWHPWEDNYVDDNRSIFHYYAEPILSDIEFDKHNNIYLSFLDRHAAQSAVFNYPAILDANSTDEVAFVAGELLKVCYQNGIYSLEGTNNCLTNYSPNPAFSYTTPPTPIHEFFNDFGVGGAHESSNGALAILKGSDQLLATVIDPHPENPTGDKRVHWDSQGVHTFNLNNGSIDNWYATAMTKGNGLSWKANGMGDIELITDTAPIEIGDRVWFDDNANGIQDANETGIKGLHISLICDNTIYKAITDNNGNYLFSNNPNNISTASHKYAVNDLEENNPNHCYINIPNISGNSRQSILNGRELTQVNLGEGVDKSLNDSNGVLNNNSAKVVIKELNIPIAGHNNHSFDIGFKPLSFYTLGDRVWIDSNRDGIQDANETRGVSGVRVNLYNNATCQGGYYTQTTTDSNGSYQFTNLVAGTYCIKFLNLPNNYYISLNNQGPDNSLDSDVNSQGEITNINLTHNDNTQDMGLYYDSSVILSNLYTLGDRVWIDSNRDGIQDANETRGVGNITVNLYNNATCEGRYIAQTTTDSNGIYQFTNLTARAYCIKFSNLPNNYRISSTNQSSDNSIDSDANSQGEITNINLTHNDNTQDMGLYHNNSVVLSNRYTLGDRVWIDSNRDGIQDSNETGINGIVVNLYNNATCSGSSTIHTTTNSNGYYQFTNLLAGSYCIEFSNLPNNYHITSANQGSDNSLDSNANSQGQIANINLTHNDNTQDMGIYSSSVLGATDEASCNCAEYTSKSVDTLNLLSISILILLTLSMTSIILKNEL